MFCPHVFLVSKLSLSSLCQRDSHNVLAPARALATSSNSSSGLIMTPHHFSISIKEQEEILG